MSQSEIAQPGPASGQNNINRIELGGLSIKDMYYKYIRYFPFFLLSVALALLIAFVYLRYSTRIYSASGNLLIKSEATSDNDKVEDILMGKNRSQNIQSEIEILRSRPLMTRVVKKLDLEFTYTPIGKIIEDLNVYKYGPFLIEAFKIKDSSSAFSTNIDFINKDQFRVNSDPTIFSFEELFENKNGVFKLKRNNRSPLPDSRYKVTWQPAEAVAGGLVQGLKVLPKTPGTGIISIGIETTNARMAADIVNTLMVEYDSMTIEQSNYSTDQMLGFIDSRLRFLNRELDSVQLNLLNFQQRSNLIDVEVQSGGSYQKITEVDKAINEEQLRANVADLIHGYLLDKRNEYNNVVVPSSLGLEDITLNELVSNYNRAQLTRQSLMASDIPVDNPAVKEAEGQIEKLRESVIENINNIKSSYNNTIALLKKRNLLEQSQFQTLPYKLKEYVELQRQVNTKLALYNLLEGKREEAAISRASTISNSKLIDLARPSDTPVKPNRRAIQIMAVVIGLALPVLFIFLKEVLNDKITTRYDIEKVTQVPIMGEIGHSFSNNTLIVNKTSRSMVAEQFRIVRSNLQYVLSKIEKPVILVTSSFSGEGKSFVSTNMASVLALTGKKTIVLEFDIRKPKILSGLGLGRKPGISNFLVGKAELKDLIVPIPDQENLFVLACGPIPPNPSELLLDQKVTELFDWVRKEFDVILVDTAPVGMVSDAMTLGKFADCTLYLVRQGRTFKKQIGLIDDLHRESKLPRISIVINDVKIKAGYGYYGYGRYGYGYGYGLGQGGYYEEEKVPQSSFERIIGRLNAKNWFRKKGQRS
jgi:capsular exopolysaccharide synthesis family protein